jgi:hypothetical protein
MEPLTPLAEAAAAAQAAGKPLPLHTLRVLEGYVPVRLLGQLLARLPNLRVLQLAGGTMRDFWREVPEGEAQQIVDALAPLAPLQQATQLEELYLDGPGPLQESSSAVTPGLLPLGLKRLSLMPVVNTVDLGDWSHLTQLNFLRLTARHHSGRSRMTLHSSALLPGLQQLQLVGYWSASEVLQVVEEQRRLMTARDVYMGSTRVDDEVHQLLPRLTNLTAAQVKGRELYSKALQAAFQQVPKLASLVVYIIVDVGDLEAAVATAAGMRSLRRLHLDMGDLFEPPALTVLTALTQLGLSRGSFCQLTKQQLQQRVAAWAGVLGGMVGIQRLSISDDFLEEGWAWLRGMQQLRVLAVTCSVYADVMDDAGGIIQSHIISSLPWLEKCEPGAVPPRLQVLGVGGITAQQAVSWGVRRRLQQLVGSGCEVVVGPHLHELASPTQQLAGLPEDLQLALA